MVKNSWGKSGQYKGIWYMSRDYIQLNTTYLFLNRHALPKSLRKAITKHDGNHGIYACSPEESSFKVVFTDMKITECAWKAHDGQQPDE